MENLEELSIKDTQVCTVHQVAKILQSCPKIKKLEFTYTEKTQEEIASGLKKENISLDSLTAAFQKLTSLKMSTTVPDQQYDIYKDPWLLLIKILRYFSTALFNLKFSFNYYILFPVAAVIAPILP